MIVGISPAIHEPFHPPGNTKQAKQNKAKQSKKCKHPLTPKADTKKRKARAVAKPPLTLSDHLDSSKMLVNGTTSN